MFKLIVIFALAAAAFADFTEPFFSVNQYDDEIIQVEDIVHKIPQGDLLGVKSGILNSFYSFKGVPYAEPPVGSLRFRSPRPHRGWSGVWDATKHRDVCLQASTIPGGANAGDEDCLYLNVYTPSLTGSRAVMLWIHGGAFRTGSGDGLFYGPEYLIKEDVVLVTINYRLGFLGFFSTGDRHAQGNYGLKDTIEALHWVQDNIALFGGDRNRVTIFGESAGSVMVNCLVMSTAARGLFHRAIGQSGVALSPWGFQPKPQELAFNISRKMNLRATTTEGIVAELRAVTDLNLFLDNTEKLRDYPIPRGQHPFQFSPVVEVDWVEPPVLTEHPLDTMKRKGWYQIPYMIGANSHESLYYVRETIIDSEIFDKYEANPHYFIPLSWGISPGTSAANEISTAVKNLYFDGGKITDKVDYVLFGSDTHFHYPTYKTVEMMAAANTVAPIYYYIFEFSGLLNMAKHALLLDLYPGAMHSDEIAYLFRMGGIPNPVIPGSTTDKVRSRMISMWTNFAKSADPTPEITSLITDKWERVGSNQEYMMIGSSLNATTQPYYERMKVWSDLDWKYGP